MEDIVSARVGLGADRDVVRSTSGFPATAPTSADVAIAVQRIDEGTWQLSATAAGLAPILAYILRGRDGCLLADPGSVVTWPAVLDAIASIGAEAGQPLKIRWVFAHTSSPHVAGSLPAIQDSLGKGIQLVTCADLRPQIAHYGTGLPMTLLHRGEVLDIGGRELIADFADSPSFLGRFILRDADTGLVIGAGRDELTRSALPQQLEKVRRALEEVLLTTLAPIALEGRALAALSPIGRVTSLRSYLFDEGSWWELGGRAGLRGRPLVSLPETGPTTFRIELSEPHPIRIDLRFAPDSAELVHDPDIATLFESLRRPLTGSMRRVISMRTAAMSERRLRAATRTDPLTGAANRRALSDWDCKGKFAALMIDLDHFKVINDTHGHGVGDQVLCQVADAIMGQIRQKDLLVRYGGDEFLLLLNGVDSDIAGRVADRVRDAVSKLSVPAGQPAGLVQLSIGVASGVGPGRTNDVVALADGALYEVKAAGRNGIHIAN